MKDYLVVKHTEDHQSVEVISTNSDDPEAILSRCGSASYYDYLVVYELAKPGPVLKAEPKTTTTWEVKQK